MLGSNNLSVKEIKLNNCLEGCFELLHSVNKRSVNFTDITNLVADETGFSPDDVHDILLAFFYVVGKQLSQGKMVSLRGFGRMFAGFHRGRKVKLYPGGHEVVTRSNPSFYINFKPAGVMTDLVKCSLNTTENLAKHEIVNYLDGQVDWYDHMHQLIEAHCNRKVAREKTFNYRKEVLESLWQKVK